MNLFLKGLGIIFRDFLFRVLGGKEGSFLRFFKLEKEVVFIGKVWVSFFEWLWL